MSLTRKILFIIPGIALNLVPFTMSVTELNNRDYWFAPGRGPERTSFELERITYQFAGLAYLTVAAFVLLRQQEKERKANS